MQTDILVIRGKEFVAISDERVHHPQQVARLLAFKNATDNRVVWKHRRFDQMRQK